ncbi:hypothetical protein E1H13_24780 [Nodosilinea sp. P-1105]|nr:hypothetical protein [Nodosilinea sp. P-1105]
MGCFPKCSPQQISPSATFYLPHTTKTLPPSALCLFCLLPSAFCLLPSAFCLLPSALRTP